MTVSQRAIFGAKISDFRHGGKRNVNQDAEMQLDNSAPKMSVTKTAKKLGISPRSIGLGKVVLLSGNPKLEEAINLHLISVGRAADIAKFTHKEQNEILGVSESGEFTKERKEITRSVKEKLATPEADQKNNVDLEAQLKSITEREQIQLLANMSEVALRKAYRIIGKKKAKTH